MNSNLQNKLQQFSAEPPEEVWNKIADALDPEETFPHRLYQYEEKPPAAVWQRMEKALEEKEPVPAKVVPFTSGFRTYLRYAAVFFFFAVLLIVITLTVKRTEAGEADAGSNTTVSANNSTSNIQNKITEHSNSIAQSTPPTQQDTNSETSPARKKVNAARPTDHSVATSRKNYRNKKETANANYASLNEYVLFSDGDGRVRKVSKKLASFVNCKDGDADCKQRLQQLRQKLAAKVVTTDFTGILEMLRQLQQKP